MKHRNFRFTALLLAAGLSMTSAASAALYSRAGGAMVYDSDLNITWLANANLAATETFGVAGINANGSMLPDTAQLWLTAMNTISYLGYSDWRLPRIWNPDPNGIFTDDEPILGSDVIPLGLCNRGCEILNNATGSDLGHLFYSEIGATAGNSIQTGSVTELSKFSNIQSGTWGSWETTIWLDGHRTNVEYIISDSYWSTPESVVNMRNSPFGMEFKTADGGLSNFGNLMIFAGKGDQLTNTFVWPVRTGDVSNVPLPQAIWLFVSALAGIGVIGCRNKSTDFVCVFSERLNN